MAVVSPEPVMYTIEQTSKRLGFAKSYVYEKFIRTGKIKSIRFGPRAVRVPSSEIDNFIRKMLEEQYGPDERAS